MEMRSWKKVMKIKILLIIGVLGTLQTLAQPFTMANNQGITSFSAVSACGSNYTFSYTTDATYGKNMIFRDNGTLIPSGWGTISGIGCSWLNWGDGVIGANDGNYNNTTLYALINTTSSPKTITFSSSAPTCGTSYYSKSTGNLDVLTNWGTATDGTGSNPANFTSANCTYNIRNNATPTLGATWTVSGSGSKIIVGDGTNACNFTIPSSFALSTPAIDVANAGTLTIVNTTIPTFGTLSSGSTVDYANTTGGQTISAVTYNNLTLSNTSGTQTAANNLTVNGTVTMAAGSTLAMGSYTLGTPTSVSMALSSQITGSGTITLGGDINFTGASAGTTIANPIDLGAADRTFTVANGSANDDVIFSGIISGSHAITKEGLGRVRFNGVNTYTGLTTLNAGQLYVGNNDALGATGSGTVVTSGQRLAIGSGMAVGAEAISIAGTGGGTYGAIDNISSSNSFAGVVTLTAASMIGCRANTVTFSNTITGTYDLTMYAVGDITVSGAITTSTGTLTKTGAGILTFSGNNTYTGTTIITAGTLQLSAANRICNSSNMQLNGGTFSTGATTGYAETIGTLDLNQSSTIALGTGNHSLTFSNSSAVSWAGITLTITGWTGSVGTSGTAGKIFVGLGGLTASQLAKVAFTGFTAGGQILATGELVPINTATPNIALASASQISSGNIEQSSTKQTLSAFTIAVTSNDATINQLVFTTAGTNVAADVTKFQLWYNTSNSLGTASQIGSDITSSLGNESHTFSGLTQVISMGSTGYFWITTDVAGAATVGHTINIASIATTDITFASGSKSGSITAGGAQSIIAPVSTITLASPSQTAASTIGRSWTNTDIAAFTLATTNANTSLTQIDFTTTGSIVDADLSNFKLWYNSTNTLNGATQIGSSITTSKGAGSHSFTSLGHALTAGTTEYYWITIDVAAGATNAATIAVSAFTTSNFSAAGTKAGSTTAGGTQTVATPVTYYSRVNGGNWNTAATWSTVGCGNASAAGAYPTAVDIVNICNGYNVNMTADHACADLIIASGATLADGGYTLSVSGNVTNNGTYSGTGKITLTEGHAEHQITSTNDNTLYKIELNDTWGAVITNSAASIKTTTITNLVLTSGIFRIGDFNNGAVYNKLTFTNAFTVASGATFKLDGNCSGDITFNDNVTIASGGTWTGTAGKTCSSIKFTTSDKLFTNNSTAQIDNSNSTYIFGYNQTLAGGSGMSIYNINCSNNFYQTQMIGSWTIRNNGTFGQGAQTHSGDLYLNNTFTFSGDWYNSTSAFTIHFNGTQNLAYPSAAWGCKFAIGGTLTFTADQYFRTDQGSTITVDAASTLNVGTYLFSYNGSKIGSSAVINNGTIKFAGATNGLATSSGTVEYNGTGAQTIFAGTYNNLIINGARSSNAITLENGTINIAGDFTPSASACTWTTTNDTVVFNGTIAQSIANAFTFNKLRFNNTSSTGVTLNAAVTVVSSLTLTDGIVYTTASNLLTLNSTATSTSGSDASYVEGPMKKIGNSTFTFPIGKSGVWARLGFTPAGGFDAATEISAEYFKSAATNKNNLGTGIHNVSGTEYWDITRVSDPSNDASCNVTLYFNNLTRSGITGTGTDLRTVHYEGGAWTDKGGTFTDNGNGTGYLVSSTALTSYSPETVGSTNGSNTLPIELTNFTATIQDKSVRINWITASETNNDYFNLERSLDGINWATIYTCNGAGTSTAKHSYYYSDNDELSGVVYYRISQTDFNGTKSTSENKSVQFKNDGITFMTYPDPARMEEMTIYIKTQIPETIDFIIYNIVGSIVSEGKIEITDKQVQFKLADICQIASGTYTILIRGRNFVQNKKIVIR
jgi:autotransporter-associated beta strand protein